MHLLNSNLWQLEKAMTLAYFDNSDDFTSES